MQETADWKLTRVAVHRDGEKTADFGSKSETRTSAFTSTELGDANVNTLTWQSMEEVVGKYGTAVVEAGVLYPEADTILSQKELMAVFQKIIHRSTQVPAAHQHNQQNQHQPLDSEPASEIRAAAVANQYYSADFKDIKDAGSVESSRQVGFSPMTGLFGSDRVKSSNFGSEYRSPRQGNRSARK